MSLPVPKPLQTVGVNDLYEHNELHLDSSQRDAGTNDSPVFYFRPPLQDVLGIKLVSAQIPFTYYVINDTNNWFQLRVGGTTFDATLPVGNYNATTLGVALQTLLDAVDTSSPANSYSVTFTATTGKLRFLHNTVDFSLLFDPDQKSPLATILGFPADATQVDSVAHVLDSPNVCIVTGDPYLLLVASVGARLAKNVRFNGAKEPSPNILAVIPVNCDPWGVIEYTDPAAEHAFDLPEPVFQQIGLNLMLGSNINTGPLALNGAVWKVYIQVLTRRETSVSNYAMGNESGAQASRRKRVRMK